MEELSSAEDVDLFVVSTVQTLKIIYQEFSCENSPVHLAKIQLELNL